MVLPNFYFFVFVFCFFIFVISKIIKKKKKKINMSAKTIYVALYVQDKIHALSLVDMCQSSGHYGTFIYFQFQFAVPIPNVEFLLVGMYFEHVHQHAPEYSSFPQLAR